MFEVLYEADGRPQVFHLTGDQATIGRATDNDIVLNDFSVSRRHAYLRKENGVWILRDNQSTNGVRVNERPVPESPIADGDEVTIGTFRLVFRQPAEPAPETAALDSTSTCIRPISEFNLDFGLEKDAAPVPESTEVRKRAVPRRLLQEQGVRDPRPGGEDAHLGRRRRDRAREGSGPDLRIPAGGPGLPAARGGGPVGAPPLPVPVAASGHLRRVRPLLANDRGHGRASEGGGADVGRPGGRALRSRDVDPHAADPLGDVRAPLVPGLGHRRHPRGLAAPRRARSPRRISIC